MGKDWAITLTTGLCATALLSVIIYLMDAPRSEQIGLWIVGVGVSALWSLNAYASAHPAAETETASKERNET